MVSDRQLLRQEQHVDDGAVQDSVEHNQERIIRIALLPQLSDFIFAYRRGWLARLLLDIGYCIITVRTPPKMGVANEKFRRALTYALSLCHGIKPCNLKAGSK